MLFCRLVVNIYHRWRSKFQQLLNIVFQNGIFIQTGHLSYQYALKQNTYQIAEQLAGKILKLFMKRHLRLSLRRAEKSSLSRATSFNSTTVIAVFEKLGRVLNKYSITADISYIASTWKNYSLHYLLNRTAFLDLGNYVFQNFNNSNQEQHSYINPWLCPWSNILTTNVYVSHVLFQNIMSTHRCFLTLAYNIYR